MTSLDKIALEFFQMLVDIDPERKKVKIGDIMVKIHTIRITDLISPAVFPSGKTPVRIADSKTIPISDSKYSLKTMPPTRKPST